MSRSFKTNAEIGERVELMTENATISTAARMMSEAGTTVAPAVRASGGTDLASPTPCGDWDLRTLVRHFLGTSSAFVRAGRTGALDPDDPWGSNAVLEESGWADRLADQVAAAGDAWSRPEAWDRIGRGSPDARQRASARWG